MSPHRTKWLCYALVVLAGPTYNPVRSEAVRTPPKNPHTIEAQAKFFQDFFSVQLSPYKIEFGHVCEDPNTWEQRYERKDYKNHRDMGKVRWGDKKGGYGEHYWDLNHAGHAANHGHDDDSSPGSDDGYHVNEHDNNDSYDEPSEQSPNYDNNEESHNHENDDYDPEKASYEEANRAKRHPKTKIDDSKEDYGSVKRIKPRQKKHKTKNAETSRIIVEDFEENEEPKSEQYKKPQRKYKPALKELDFEDDETINTYTDTDPVVKASTGETQDQYTHQPETEPTRYVQYAAGARKAKISGTQGQYTREPETESTSYVPYEAGAGKATISETQDQYTPQPEREPPHYVPYEAGAGKATISGTHDQYTPQPKREPVHYVPYEAGAGVRQYRPPDVTPAATVSRLFLEASTGHVVDRATGQAYILQPIVTTNRYNVN